MSSNLNEDQNIQVIIDYREKELYNACKSYIEKIPHYKCIRLISENLPLGDIIIKTTIEEKLIIERKSLNDLSSSIKDGRYEEQSYRLSNSNIHNHNIIYLIEGDIQKYKIGLSSNNKDIIYSAMFSINHYKGFSLMRSLSILESAYIICNAAYKVHKELKTKTPYYKNLKNNNDSDENNDKNIEKNVNTNNENENKDIDNLNNNDNDIENENTKNGDTKGDTKNDDTKGDTKNDDTKNEINDKSYCAVHKNVKKNNITQHNISEIMLCQIPGISSVTSLAIFKKFNTIANLIISIKEDPNCLNNITYLNNKNQERKINKSVIQNIIKYLQL
jgi:ERCC4-type nuclease